MAKLNNLTISASNTQQGSIVSPKGKTVERLFPVFFKDVGTFNWTVPAGVTSLRVLCVGGGGGGGYQVGGGGGAGGVVFNSNYTVTPGTTLTITVGNGGAGATNSAVSGFNGQNSVVSGGATTITAIGGGGGGSHNSNNNAQVGGSGGGGGGPAADVSAAGASGTPDQGRPGGSGLRSNWSGGGGGGAGAAGENSIAHSGGYGGAGGHGLMYTISGTPAFYGGGGGGCSSTGSFNSGVPRRAPGGLGGGGFGGDSNDVQGTAGEPNTGGGGGGERDAVGGGGGGPGKSGGSGIIILDHVVSFTTTGSTTWTAPAGITSVEVLVVAGGGGGGFEMGGGGGGGGVIYEPNFSVTPGQSYTVAVGAGGAGRTSNSDNGGQGGDSIFGTLTAIGGGAGGNNSSPYNGTATGGRPRLGGSGGGSGESSPAAPGTPGQGFMGGIALEAPNYPSGGGGGAAGAGQSPNSNQDNGGAGGPGLPFAISGDLRWYGGGGGGGIYVNGGTPGKGGIGGAGDGAYWLTTNGSLGTITGTNAANNTGSGGGGGSYNGSASGSGGAGGSGIVILRFNSETDGSLAGTIRYNTVLQSTELWNNGNWQLQNRDLNQGFFDNTPDPRSIQGLTFWVDPAEQVRGDTSRLRDLTGNNRLIHMVNHVTGTATPSGRYFRNTFGGVLASHQSLGGHIIVAPTTGFNNSQLNFAAGENFSIVMWTYRTNPDVCGTWMAVDSGVGGEGYRIWREACGGAAGDDWNMYYDGTNNNTVNNGTNNRYKVWQMHIWQREENQSSIYAYYGSNDYASTASWSHTGAFSLLNGNSSALTSKGQWLHFGNSAWASTTEALAGFLGPIMIYRKALTANERLLVFNFYKTRFGLI
jgi:hypothetical protein